MKITKAEERREENTNNYNWHFTINNKEEVIIPEEKLLIKFLVIIADGIQILEDKNRGRP